MELNGAPAPPAGARPELSPAAEDYLVGIAALAERGRTVTGAALARCLGVSPPSVTQMVARLVQAGLVVPRVPRASRNLRSARKPVAGRGITLTTEGAAHAAWLLQRRRLCERFLEKIGGLDASAAARAACAAEHGLPERAIRRMAEMLRVSVRPRGVAPAAVSQTLETIPGDPGLGAPPPQACGRGERIRLTAERVDGPCASGHRAGDTFMLTRHTPAGLCGASYAALLPWIRWLLGDALEQPGPRLRAGHAAITQRCPGDGFVLWRAEALDAHE